jgi:4-diphosphocytidyl-2-C-methyl-D-erythritol kinase
MTHAPYSTEFPWPAPAKLNLFLHITGRRADGYHKLQTVFQFLDFGDSLFFTPRGDGVIRRVSGPPDVAAEQDLVVRAAQALKSASGCELGADIGVEKRIPMGGGLGGGSSDAATTLVALNQLWNLGFTQDELARIGLKLGADVPVFVRGAAAWAEGVGEHLRPLILPEPVYLVLTPAVQVSTAEIFGAAELKRDSAPISVEDFLAGAGGNDCEPVTCARHPEVREALAWLRGHGPARDAQDARVPRAHGCAGAAMSGTGASVFLGFATRAEARVLQDQVPPQWRSFVAVGLNQSPLLGIMRAA